MVNIIPDKHVSVVDMFEEEDDSAETLFIFRWEEIDFIEIGNIIISLFWLWLFMATFNTL